MSCNLVHVTLKVVWADIPSVCFCVKHQTTETPSGRTRAAAAGHFAHSTLWKNKLSYHETPVVPPLHASPPPPFWLDFFLLPLSHFIHCYFLWMCPAFLLPPLLLKPSLCFLKLFVLLSGDTACERVQGLFTSISTSLLCIHFIGSVYQQ